VEITYDPIRRDINLKRYGIDLADVEDVFTDIFALTLRDESYDREQFVMFGERVIALGTDGFGRLIVVTYTYVDENKIRVISARRADSHERQFYEEG